MCFQSFLLPFWHLHEDTRSDDDDTRIVNLFKNILSVPKKHIIHVDLVWQLWMGGGQLMGHLASGCGFNSVFVTWIEVLGMMSTSFFSLCQY
jgi:hypothetical protein